MARSITLCIAVCTVSLHATTFFLDPEQGRIENDGSSASPWSTLEEVFDNNLIESRDWESKPPQSSTPLVRKNEDSPVGAGDTLMLRSGYHGTVYASGYYNEDWITIMAQSGHTPRLGAIELRSGCRWRIAGLTVSPSFAPSYERTTLIEFSSHGWHGASYRCIAENNTGYSVADASGWTVTDWNEKACNALSLPDMSIARGNHFKNVNFGISSGGDSVLVEYNTVENFSGDGMRGLGDYQVFQYNTVKNCYDVNANHDDGFQSWSSGDGGPGTGVVKGMVLRGNTIIDYEDPGQPFRGSLQGIGCFDGMFEDWLVVNNVIVCNHWHGITLLGANNCTVINNTVVDRNLENPGPPWIKVDDHKNGTPPQNCIVRNNLTTALACASEGVTVDHNIDLSMDVLDDYFVDYAAFDLRLKAGCPAVDSGTAASAPPDDHDRLARPAGSGVDIGAHEYGGVSEVRHVPPGRPGARVLHATSSLPGGIVRIAVAHRVAVHGSRLDIFSPRGRLVATIPAAQAGDDGTITWNAGERAAGVYCVRLASGTTKYTSWFAVTR